MEHSEVAKRKISIAKMGNACALGHRKSATARKKISSALKGRKFTEERCHSMSLAAQKIWAGKPQDERNKRGALTRSLRSWQPHVFAMRTSFGVY